MKIRIRVTKQIYEASMFCPVKSEATTTNCAIALAVREIAPKASVNYNAIFWNGKENIEEPYSNLESHIWNYILAFDQTKPKDRPNLPEFSFEVEFPDSMVEQIGIGQVYKILSESKTLQHV